MRGVFLPSDIFTIVDENKDVNDMISN